MYVRNGIVLKGNVVTGVCIYIYICMGGPLQRQVFMKFPYCWGSGGFVYMLQLVSCIHGAFTVNVWCRMYDTDQNFIHDSSLHLVGEVHS